MDYWELYKSRLELEGNTRREAAINNLKKSLINGGLSNPSLKEVLINNNKSHLFINNGSKPYYKKIISFPDHPLFAGDIIRWNDFNWLIINADSDNEISVSGNMEQCNYYLRWQDSSGNIIEIPCVKIGNTSQGVDEDKIIKLGGDEIGIKVAYDSISLSLKRGMRFFVDNKDVDALVYRIQKTDTTSNVYNNHGYIYIVLKEDELKVNNDNIELKICDYNYNITPSPANNLEISRIISKVNTIKLGTRGTVFKAEFYLNDIPDNDVIPEWKIVCDFIDELTIIKKDKTITISATNNELLDRYFKIKLNDTDNLYQESELLVKIVEVF